MSTRFLSNYLLDPFLKEPNMNCSDCGKLLEDCRHHWFFARRVVLQGDVWPTGFAAAQGQPKAQIPKY
jgi:hypothetical protein